MSAALWLLVCGDSEVVDPLLGYSGLLTSLFGLLSGADESDARLLGAVELGASLLGAALLGPLDGASLDALCWLESIALDWLLCPLGALLLDSSDAIELTLLVGGLLGSLDSDVSEATELTLLAGGLLGSLDTDTWEATELTLLAGGLLGALDAEWSADSLL